MYPLLTDANRRDLVAAGEQWQAAMESEIEPEDDPQAECIVKLFDPCGRWTLYVFSAEEADTVLSSDDLLLYGYCVSPLGPDCDEWGYSSLEEIQQCTNAYKLSMERDRYFSGCTRADLIGGKRP